MVCMPVYMLGSRTRCSTPVTRLYPAQSDYPRVAQPFLKPFLILLIKTLCCYANHWLSGSVVLHMQQIFMLL